LESESDFGPGAWVQVSLVPESESGVQNFLTLESEFTKNKDSAFLFMMPSLPWYTPRKKLAPICLCVCVLVGRGTQKLVTGHSHLVADIMFTSTVSLLSNLMACVAGLLCCLKHVTRWHWSKLLCRAARAVRFVDSVSLFMCLDAL